jgi:hypothetical protein
MFDEERRTSRRSILVAAFGAISGFVASAVSKPASVYAGVDGDVVLGAGNSTTTTTGIASSGTGAALEASTSSSTGWAVKANSTAFPAVYADSTGNAALYGVGHSANPAILGQALGAGGPGVVGSSGINYNLPPTGTGMLGFSGNAIGVNGVSSDISNPGTNVLNAGMVGVAGNPADIASNIALTGVYGWASGGVNGDFVPAGVWGDSGVLGVVGTGATGVIGIGPLGVDGYAATSGGIGVLAEGVGGSRALRVAGRAEFTRSGRTTIAAGASSKKVTLSGCTTSTLVFAVLATSRPGRWIRAVVPASGSFTIYLNTSVTSSTAIVWIAFTNPSNHSG